MFFFYSNNFYAHTKYQINKLLGCLVKQLALLFASLPVSASHCPKIPFWKLLCHARTPSDSNVAKTSNPHLIYQATLS
jgi:hypothetical protein